METQTTDTDMVTISLKGLWSVLWKEKWLVLLITIICSGLGGYYAFTRQEQFVSEGKILPEFEAKGAGMSQFAGLASLAGVDLGKTGGSEAIRPDLYPDILKSTPFFMDLFPQKMVTQDGTALTFDQFIQQYLEKGEEPTPEALIEFKAKPKGVVITNGLIQNRIKGLKERIFATIDKKSGVITISVKLPDPVMAAQVAKYAMDYVTNYVTNYRTEKAKQDLDFLGERVASARGKYYTKQSQKAQYADQFQAPTIRLQAADIQRERIESDYRISANFYNELLKKYEEAKIKVQQETPVFKVLEPPTAPVLKSEPKRAIILLASAFFGGVLAVLVALVRKKNYQTVFLTA
jgi:uncharacterized protein involved in exopolysaccharide biosynthesis